MNKMFLKNAAGCCFFLISSALFASSYKIESIDYKITGITRQNALERTVPVDKNTVFETEEDFIEYIDTLKQDLINTRCFGVSNVEYSYKSPDSEGPTPVSLLISVADNYHFLCLPYFKYSSSNGLTLKLKAKDTNFLGTMNVLNTSFDFQFEPDSSGKPFQVFEPEISFSFDYPFAPREDGLQISLINDYTISYTWGENSPEWNLSSGVKLEKPVFNNFLQRNTTATFVFKQSFIRDFDYRISSDETFFKEYGAFLYPVILHTDPELGNITVSPYVSATYNWDPFKRNGASGIKNKKLQGPELEMGNDFTFGRANWIGNFRSGMSDKFSVSFAYNTASIFVEDVNPLSFCVSADVMGFIPSDYIALYYRSQFFWYPSGKLSYGSRKVDDSIRGVIDNRLGNLGNYQAETPAAFILNLDLPVKILTTDWANFPITKKIGFTKKLNFEVQAAPFIDLALIQTTEENHGYRRAFNPKDGFYGAGLEVLIFPEKWSSYVIRASLGIDVGRKLYGELLDNSWRNTSCRSFEILIGLGTHY